MNYQDTVNWMFSQLPMYQNQGKPALKKDLTNTLALAAHLGNPHQKFKSVHVAGTNGKGSTSHMIASVLQEAGYKVGLYTSPHLKDFRERIKINGKEVSKDFVVGFVKENKPFFESLSPSFFEMTVAMAFDYFAKQQVDIAVIEVGLGGRLDSTNIINPEVSVITNIGFDHTQFLGNTLNLIACEKAGIIKPKTPVIIGETQTETQGVFKRIAKEQLSTIVFADRSVTGQYPSDLKGSYQNKNITTCVATLLELNKLGFSITDSQIKQGLLHVVKNTGLKGRWQVLQEQPKLICDTAHNKEGLRLVMSQLSTETFNHLHMVLGFVNDKDLTGIIPLFPKNATYYFCRPDVQRGLDAERVKVLFLKQGFSGTQYSSVSEALEKAKENAQASDLIYVGGSTFVVAEIL